VKHIELTSEWISNWAPARRTELADRGCKGLVLRGGPSSKVFFRWADAKDPVTGAVRRRRVRLGAWPGFSLNEARKVVNDARETAPGTTGADLTVSQLAEAYRRDILSHREPASLAWSWNMIKTHVLPALPNAKRPPFGEWAARLVRAQDVAEVVRAARVERTVEVAASGGKTVRRTLGGPAAARATLREVKAIFAAAVTAGTLETTPAGVLQAKSLGLRGSKRGRYLDAEEIKALFEALELNKLLDGTAEKRKLTPTVRLGIAFLLYVPVRSHSLVGARWQEMNLDAAQWTIPVARLKLHKDERVEARPFTVPLPSTAISILKKLQALAKKTESPFVLASPKKKGEPQRIGNKVMVRALARLQEDGRLSLGSTFTVHDLRRTWRSWAQELKVSFEVAERSLDHVLPGVAGIYARAPMLEQRTTAAELVAAAFDRIRLGTQAQVVPIAEREHPEESKRGGRQRFALGRSRRQPSTGHILSEPEVSKCKPLT